MSQVPYLFARVINHLNIRDINPRDVSLAELTAVWMKRHVEGRPILDIAKMNVPSFTVRLAGLLDQGRIVYIRDTISDNLCFIKAHGKDLVAVFHHIHPTYDIYSAMSTGEHVLEQLGVTTATFTDKQLLDKIFGFEPTSGYNNKQETAPVGKYPIYTWYHAAVTKHQPEQPQQAQRQPQQQKQQNQGHQNKQHRNAPRVENQMTHAFSAAEKAVGKGTRREQDQRNIVVA